LRNCSSIGLTLHKTVHFPPVLFSCCLSLAIIYISLCQETTSNLNSGPSLASSPFPHWYLYYALDRDLFQEETDGRAQLTIKTHTNSKKQNR